MEGQQYRFTVCVRSLIYNHEKYINDCLHGFMMQEVSFPVVFLLEDDASTDSTSQILSDWVNTNFNVEDKEVARIIDFEGAVTTFAQHKFNPNFYVAYVQMKYNHYRKFSRDAYNSEWRTSAKYIAMCEGDDYWTDPLKLQKQVDYMESHDDYSMCFHTAEVLTESAEEKNWFPIIEERDYSPREIMAQWCINTCTVMYRRHESVLLNIRNENIVFGDIYIWELLAEAGNVRGLSFCGAVYRRNSNGISQTINCSLARRLAKQYRFMGRRFPIIKKESQNMEDFYLRYLMTHDESDQVWRDVYRLTMHHPHFIFSKYFVKAVSFMFKDVLLK